MVMGQMESMARTSHLSGGNLAYIEALYERYLEDASEVPAEWRDYFDKLPPGAGTPSADVPHGPVNNIGQALNQPIIQESGFLRETAHPTAGKIKVPGSPLRFRGLYEELRVEPPPLLGEHTREVLGNLAGLDDAAVTRLITAGVVATPEQAATKICAEELKPSVADGPMALEIDPGEVLDTLLGRNEGEGAGLIATGGPVDSAGVSTKN